MPFWYALWLLIVAVVAVWHGPTSAATLESALSPGKLSKAHAKLEGECGKCHVPFDRGQQNALCADCHKDVAADIRAQQGFHGRQKPQACRSCHTEHKGVDMAIAEFDTQRFDHHQTDFQLRGKHVETTCAKCHERGKRWREAPQDCVSCHRRDDVHKGSLGAKCADCHVESSWKEARFDHSTTRFALKGRHADVRCASCHKGGVYRETPMTCIGCHRGDDRHKGRYGEKCETCHDASSWKRTLFNHDSDTSYALRGKHRAAKCDSCHVGSLYKDKLGTDCVSCHRKDDRHEGKLGPNCASCHQENSWRETGRFDHQRTRFPLRGKHVQADCKDCHKSANYREAPSDCYSCHRKDDKHESNLGVACESCHGETGWKTTRFDHAGTRFALRGGHANVECKSCHVDLRSYRGTTLACSACHRKDDKHEGQLGTACESCHDDSRWKSTRFDHAKARFALVGAHLRVACADCHKTQRYRDAPSDCVACHLKDDRHKARLGTACASCHNARAWRLARFDHDRLTDYPLEGRHARVACESCHVKAAPAGRKVAPLGRACIDCHVRDDVHDGGFGARCETCHQASGWKQLKAGRTVSPAATGAAGNAAGRTP
jgi:hypothetical protein